MNIKKASGQEEPFNKDKLGSSIRRVGLTEGKVKEIVQKVQRELYAGISSQKILEIVLRLIREEDLGAAAKYNLKKAIMNLGPSGYPFEKYFAGVLKRYGYQTKVGEIVPGHCVPQEIDIVAVKDDRRLIVECKYHNGPGIQTDLKVALYTYARFLDVKEFWSDTRDCQAVLVTNTKFTSPAIKFAQCRNIKMIGWHYPATQNLEKFIEDKSLYPITILFSLKNQSVNKLLENGIIFTEDLIGINVQKTAQELAIPLNEMKKLQEEAEQINIRTTNQK